MSFSRMIPFLLLNIIVSAIVVIVILTFWDRRSSTLTPAADGVDVSAEITTNDTVGIEPAIAPLLSDNVAVAQPTAVPDQPSQVTHIVASGELLGSISVQYDVSVEDIVTANGLTDPNQIFVGQELIMPVGGLEEVAAVVAPVDDGGGDGVSAETTQPTAVPTTATEPTPVPTVAVATGDSTLEISGVTAVGDVANESVIITNSGANAVALEGWTVSDETGQTYTFSNFTLFPGGAAIQLATRSAEDTGATLYWNQTVSAWQTGETVTLRDSGGNVQATYTIP